MCQADKNAVSQLELEQKAWGPAVIAHICPRGSEESFAKNALLTRGEEGGKVARVRLSQGEEFGPQLVDVHSWCQNRDWVTFLHRGCADGLEEGHAR